MKHPHFNARGGFTLIETVIAIGVLAVLLSGFVVVFAPAAQGVRNSISSQQADRLATTFEQELSTLRPGEASADIVTGFDKAFDRISTSNNVGDALMAYQYRARVGSLRSDQSPTPVTNTKGLLPGEDYIVVPMVRKRSDAQFTEDLPAVEGPVYLVKCTQLILKDLELTAGKPGEITDPKGEDEGSFSLAKDYPEAVLAFSADFYIMPTKTPSYFSGGAFTAKFSQLKNPVFSRNLAVRR